MSYRCEQCGKTSCAGEKQNKKVIAKRPRHYACGSVGWEIVKEICVCDKCKE